MSTRVATVCVSAMALWAFAIESASSAPYPDHPIRIVVPAAAGSVPDVFVRRLSEHMSRTLEQPIIVDNRAGANGFIGAEAVARAKPDGYTVIYGAVNVLSINPALYSQMPYDPGRDFAPVSLIARGYPILIVNPSLPVKTLSEFIDYARDRPGKLTYGSPGVGSLQHIASELLEQLANVDLIHVPYKNQPQVMTDLIGGQLDAAVEYPSVAVPQIKAGKVRALVIVGPKRKPAIPEVPTAAEVGLPGFQAAGWAGFLVPAGTPREVIDKLNKAIIAALAQPQFLEWIAGNGTEALPSTPEEFASYIKAETAKWSKVVKDAKVKAE
jgi:tripartite-type tricarboxylate transporter receptor subunit TctC